VQRPSPSPSPPMSLPKCCTCNTRHPFLLAAWGEVTRVVPRRCPACLKSESLEIAAVIRRASSGRLKCACDHFREIGAIGLLPCLACRRSPRPVCHCKTEPSLLHHVCPDCDPSRPRRKYDRCQCHRLKPRVDVTSTGDAGEFLCLDHWLDWYAWSDPYCWRGFDHTGTHRLVTSQRFRVVAWSLAADVAAIVNDELLRRDSGLCIVADHDALYCERDSRGYAE